MRALPLALAALLAVTGCSQFPEVDASVSDATQHAAYPELVPLETLRARMDAPTLSPTAAASFDARVARLKARAAGLKRQSVVDDATHGRMRDGVQ